MTANEIAENLFKWERCQVLGINQLTATLVIAFENQAKSK